MGQYFSARVVKPMPSDVSCLVFQPDLRMEGLEIPVVLTKDRGSFLLHVLNTTDKTITIPKGTRLGSVTEAAEILKEGSAGGLEDRRLEGIHTVGQ
jgi:hypothetical protein